MVLPTFYSVRVHSGLVSVAMCAVVLFVASPNEDDIRQESALLTKISKIGIIKGLKVLLFANRICSQRKRDNKYYTRHYDVKTYKCSDKCIMLTMGGVTEGARGTGNGSRLCIKDEIL